MRNTSFSGGNKSSFACKKRAFVAEHEPKPEHELEQPSKKMKLTAALSPILGSSPLADLSSQEPINIPGREDRKYEKLNNLLKSEMEYPTSSQSLLHQRIITPRMRLILLDWMNEVCTEYGLQRETFQLAVSYVDRFLEKHRNLPTDTLQLVGAGALLVASKIEEYLELTPDCLSVLTDHSYSTADICQFEALLAASLDWKLLPPTPLAFLCIFSEHFSCDISSRLLQLVDLALLVVNPFPASLLAAGAWASCTNDIASIAEQTKLSSAEIASVKDWLEETVVKALRPDVWVPAHTQSRYPSEINVFGCSDQDKENCSNKRS